MADAAVSFAIENVRNFLIQEGNFLFGVRDEVEEMQIELEWMQCFLKDAERRKEESHRVQKWISQIREATYDVEDLIERFVFKTALRNRQGVMNRIKKYAFFINHVVELHQVGSKIEGIKTKLTNLRTRLQNYGIRELRVGGEEAHVINRRKKQDYAHVIDHNVVGLDEKITELVQRLLSVEEASVVCIYGMGGLGKTTTAKQVYSDSRIKTHFESFAWVYISQQVNGRQVWESILSQLSDRKKEEVEKMSTDDLTSQLCHLQKEKKCLLVLDDIWQNQDWDQLSAALPYLDANYRSKILFTTRNENVASNGVYRTSLDILDHNTSLELLKNTILFLGGPNHPIRENSSMDNSAGEMVKKCAGLPLAIIVLGGILATKHELREWERVGDNINLVLKRGERNGNDGVTSVLESSYEDLPYNLRSCFLYFSQYREDEEIGTTDLIQRRIGEGFVSSSMEEGDETMEDVAEEHLNELLSRCVIQVGSKGHTGRVKTCRMHDLMRDLCISKAKEESFSHSIKLGVENKGKELDKLSFRRLCIFSSGGSHKLDKSVLSSLVEISPHLRSICFHISHEDLEDVESKEAALILQKLKFVRVIELTGKSESEQIGNLIHLRFLKLKVPKLSTSIGNLRCLQTLNLELCSVVFQIPDSLWLLEQLRHLYLPRNGSSCESSKQRVGDFRNLQTLVNFPPEKLDLQQNLVKFTNVRKLVVIRCSEDIGKIIRSQEIAFKRLESLSFMYSSRYVNLDVIRDSPRLHRLLVRMPKTFHEAKTATCGVLWPSNLTKLVLEGSLLDESHMGTLGKLQSLKVLFLHQNSFTGKEMVFDGNDFPQLRHLKLRYLENLETWAVHEGALPNLLCLEISNCWKLKSVPDGSQFLKQLKELKVKDMPHRFRKWVEQGGVDWDKVSHVPSVSFSQILNPDSCSKTEIARFIKGP